jgi:hypothetical protein
MRHATANVQVSETAATNTNPPNGGQQPAGNRQSRCNKMRRLNLVLLASLQLARARQPGFSIHDDLLAHPQVINPIRPMPLRSCAGSLLTLLLSTV